MLSVWMGTPVSVCDTKAGVSGLSWGSLVSSVPIQDLDVRDRAGEKSSAWSGVGRSSQSLLLLASVVATTSVEVIGSVDRLVLFSRDRLVASVRVCVCSVSTET